MWAKCAGRAKRCSPAFPQAALTRTVQGAADAGPCGLHAGTLRRMKENGKWFAVIMHVSRSRLGLPGPGSVEVINLKDTPQEVKKRLETDGFLRADHMDRTNWYTVCLDDTAEDRQLKALISRSYALVRSKRR